MKPHRKLLDCETALNIERVSATITATAAAWRQCRVPGNLGGLEAGALLQVFADDLQELLDGVAKPGDTEMEDHSDGK